MTCLSSRKDTALTPQSEQVRVLGETGDTVIYLFPDGRAVADLQGPDLDASQQSEVPEISTAPSVSGHSEERLLDNLIAAGKMSLAQKEVVLHDHQITGMNIGDILSARGWT